MKGVSAFRSVILGAVLVVMLCFAAGACGDDGGAAEQWLEGLSLADGARVINVEHFRGVDSLQAEVAFPEPVDQSGIPIMLGDPDGYDALAASEQIADEVGGARLVADIRADGSPCVTSVWAIPEPSRDESFGGTFLRVACESA